MKLWECSSYQDWLLFQSKVERGNLKKMAEAAGCQSSYLLRAIRREGNLTNDQAFRLSKYWTFSTHERDFFMTLVERERTGDNGYRIYLDEKLRSLKTELGNLKNVVNREEVSDVRVQLEYHRDPQISLVHFLTACAPYGSLNELWKRTGLPLVELERVLFLLEQNGFVDRRGDRVKYLTGSGHIERDSPVLSVFLNNWRQLAVQRSIQKSDHSVHFSNIQTIAVADIEKLVQMARRFILDSKGLCDASGSEDVVAVNLDVFIP